MKRNLHKIISGAVFGLLLLCGTSASAQIDYTQGFDDDTHGWELEELELDDELFCNGTGALSANLWYYSDFAFGYTYAEMISPALGVSNGGAITVSYSYKVIDYDGETPTDADFGNVKAYYSSSATGPWILFDTVDANTHTPSDECAVRTVGNIPVGAGSSLFLKITATHNYDDLYDYYIVFDDVNVEQAAPIACSAAPAATTAVATQYSVCNTNNAIVLSMADQYIGTGITFQWQSSADNVTYTNIPAATGTTYSATPSATTWYRVVATCTNGNFSTPSAPARIVSTGPICYCAVAFAGGIEPITRVNMGTINNVSQPGAPGSTAYEDFTNFDTNVTIGLSYPITVEGNSIYETDMNEYNVYFDWNHNGILDDAGEAFYIGSITGSTGTDGQFATASITVPQGALTGYTRMRVIKKYNIEGLPCNTTGYGQAEDYLVNVQAVAGTPSFDANSFSYYPNPVKDVLNLKHISGIENVSVYNLMGQLVLNENVNSAETTLDMSAFATGAYLVKVTAAGAVKTIKVAKQ